VRAVLTRSVVTAAALCCAGPAAGVELGDLFFGEALFYAHQQHHFEALERLDAEIAQHYGVDEPQLDSLHPYIGHAEFCVGDFELSYRMHHRAGRAIKAVLEADVAAPVRNEAAYRLARIHFQKGQPGDALQALEGIRGEVPEAIRNDVEFLRANVHLALDRPSDAADVLRGLQGDEGLRGFSAYNLGIALLRDGRLAEAIQQLDAAGRVEGSDRATLAIRDKANLVLGTLLFEASAFDRAARSLDRVRLEGPFSNQALLRAGWSDASAENFARALVPWSILAEREPTDAAVQEALLALPYAYSKLNVHGRAARLYGRAVEAFGHELAKVDASIRSIEEGAFLEALAREEIRQDHDWVIRLRRLPDAPETFYLIDLLASHDFQTALQNYLDLEDMRKKLIAWQRSLDAFEDLIRLRREYYEPLLPEIDRQFRRLDARMRLRLEQRMRVEDRLDRLLVDPRPDHLMTADERTASAHIARLESSLGGASDPGAEALRLRIRRLKGALSYRLASEYHQRLTDAHLHLRELSADVEALQADYAGFVRARQAAEHGYVGWGKQIDRLRGRIEAARERLGDLMERQGEVLEAVADEELKRRRERLVTYRNQARFAFADSYDRAAKAQGR
jgi:predicted negative regulator of RcsB-dependent stress response